MKKVVLIPDSFKGTMSSSRIIEIMKERILFHFPECKVLGIPVADGGEGTVDAFLSALGGEKIYIRTKGPYFETVDSFYGILPDGTAVIEMASSAGLPLVGERKNPSLTTTYGVGELILDAARRGSKRIVIGLGGSATNDAGCGAAAACGVKFLDGSGEAFVPTGGTLDRISSIDNTSMDPTLKGVEIITMCDIDNPLHGTRGAAYVYGPQKGADEAMVAELDTKLEFFSGIVKKSMGIDLQKIPGAGSAGGMGAGMITFFSSRLEMGIDTVLSTVDFSSLVEEADYVFTGEGKIDTQSLRGKVVIGVARKAKEKRVPVIAFVGDIGDDVQRAYEEGVSAIFSINRVAVPYKEARLRAESDLSLTVDNFLRFIKISGFKV